MAIATRISSLECLLDEWCHNKGGECLPSGIKTSVVIAKLLKLKTSLGLFDHNNPNVIAEIDKLKMREVEDFLKIYL